MFSMIILYLLISPVNRDDLEILWIGSWIGRTLLAYTQKMLDNFSENLFQGNEHTINR